MFNLDRKQISLFSLLIVWTLSSSCQTRPTPSTTGMAAMADVHLHYNWNQEEVISPREAVTRLCANNVRLAAVSSRPADMAIKLREAAGDWVIPLYSPYYKAGVKDIWYRFPQLLGHVREALASGRYKGIGETHLVSGMGPRLDNEVLNQLIQLAQEFNVPMVVHTDASRHTYFHKVCSRYPKVRFLWAHAGGVLDASEVGQLLAKCDNVWVELSARDPWHYGYLTDETGRLLPGWVELISRYPDRFMTGTDPVWNAHQTYRWYEADEGWFHYDKLNRFHRAWMAQLPTEVERKVRLDNAVAFFNTPPRGPQQCLR